MGHNLQIPRNPCKQKHGKLIRFIRLYAPSHNGPVKQVDDSVCVQEYASYWSFQPGHVPGPNLIWSCHNHFIALPGGTGLPGLATMDQCITLSQHPVHAGHACYVSSFLRQGCYNLLRGAVSKPLAGRHCIQGIPFLVGKGASTGRMTAPFPSIT